MERRAVDVVWVLLCGVLSSVWCLTAARDLGVTFDEPIYIEKGLERWREGTLTPLIRLGTMPLPVDVQTFPVYVWERFRGTPFDARADLPAERIEPATLPPGWTEDLAATRARGDAWLTAGRTARLDVPSALVPETWNILLNPAHPDAARARIVEVGEHPLDARLSARLSAG